MLFEHRWVPSPSWLSHERSLSEEHQNHSFLLFFLHPASPKASDSLHFTSLVSHCFHQIALDLSGRLCPSKSHFCSFIYIIVSFCPLSSQRLFPRIMLSLCPTCVGSPTHRACPDWQAGSPRKGRALSTPLLCHTPAMSSLYTATQASVI